MRIYFPSTFNLWKRFFPDLNKETQRIIVPGYRCRDTDNKSTGKHDENGIKTQAAKCLHAYLETGGGYYMENFLDTFPSKSAWKDKVTDKPADVVLRHHGERVADGCSSNKGGNSADPHKDCDSDDPHGMEWDGRRNADEDTDGRTHSQGFRVSPQADELQGVVPDCATWT